MKLGIIKQLALLVGLLTTAIAGSAMAQGSDNTSKGKLAFFADYTCFKYFEDEKKTYVQLHFYLERSSLKFVPVDTLFSASFKMEIQFLDAESGTKIAESIIPINLEDAIAARDTVNIYPLIFESNFALKPGTYNLKVSVTDDNDANRTGYFTELIGVPSFKGNDLQLSQVELTSKVLKGGAPNDMFVKYGYTIYPNPSKFYGTNLPRAYIFGEIYNLKYDASKPDETYAVDIFVTDQNGDEAKRYPQKTYTKKGPTALLMKSLFFMGLKSGRYFLNVRVTDNTSGKMAQQREWFIVFKEGESIAEVKAEESYFKDLDKSGAEIAGHIVRYAGTEKEYDVYKNLDLEGQKKFLDRFWSTKDPSPGTKTNELLTEFYKRYQLATMKFGTVNLKGWKTDMGRVFITYGEPAQIEKHEFEPNKKPYEIWYYIQLKDQPYTQTVFVFSDKASIGSKQLIHSNARGEFNNPSWESEISN